MDLGRLFKGRGTQLITIKGRADNDTQVFHIWGGTRNKRKARQDFKIKHRT